MTRLTIKQVEPTRLIVTGLDEEKAIAFLTRIKEWRDDDSEEPLAITLRGGAGLHLYDLDGTNHKFAVSGPSELLYHKPSELKLSYIPKDEDG